MQVSGTMDGVFEMGTGGEKRSQKLAEAEAAARAKAVQAGAHPSSCKVVKHWSHSIRGSLLVTVVCQNKHSSNILQITLLEHLKDLNIAARTQPCVSSE